MRGVTRMGAVAALSLAATAIPAVANASSSDCPLKSAQVCLYSSGQKVAAYQDQTSYWQTFNGAHRITYAINAFDPDPRTAGPHVAYFRHKNGVTSCIEPGREASTLVQGYGDVEAIAIGPGGKCYPGTGG
jgi:hypothetical protein